MILSKTPLKLPFAGGLTDLKSYADKYGGVTVSTTVDKYVYIALKENLGGYFRLKYQDVQEKVNEVEHIKHDLIRETVKLTGLQDEPLDLVIMADLAGESGLGSSGAVTVGLLHALHAYKGEVVTKEQLIEEACRVEVDILEGASGYHDPAICALGGLKRIEYHGRNIIPKDVSVPPATLQAFQDSLLFFYGGRHHKSKPSLALLNSHMGEAVETLHAIRRSGYDLEGALEASELARVAALVGEMQSLKQRLPGHFVDDYVLDVVARVRATGAYAQLPGGKISAFVMVCCPDGQQDAVRRALPELREMMLKFETGGTQVTEI